MYSLTVLMLFGLLFIPFGLPIYSLDTYIKYDYPYEKLKLKEVRME